MTRRRFVSVTAVCAVAASSLTVALLMYLDRRGTRW